MPADLFVNSTFYKFIRIEDPKALQLQLLKSCKDNKILGTILLANEGINASIGGTRQALDDFYNLIETINYLNDFDYKETLSQSQPFSKLKIKIKSEIIKFNISGLDVKNSGTRLNGHQWEALIDRGAVVIDTRNDYEIKFGTFKNAINPGIKHFTELAKWLDDNLSSVNPDRPIAMFCTGGVRCEKSTAYLVEKGFKNVYHLNGGIIGYLNESKHKEQYWDGNCFVFDDRIAIDKNLQAA